MNLEDQSVDSLWTGHWLERRLVLPRREEDTRARRRRPTFGNDRRQGERRHDPERLRRPALPLRHRDEDGRAAHAGFRSRGHGRRVVQGRREHLRHRRGPLATRGLFRCNPKKRTFERIETGFEVAASGDIAREQARRRLRRLGRDAAAAPLRDRPRPRAHRA